MLSAKLQVKDVVEFVLQNRKNDAFKNGSPDGIAYHICKAIECNLFHYSVDKEGNINGVCTCSRFDEFTIKVDNILLTEPHLLKEYMKYYIKRFPSCKIIGNIRGRKRIFNDTTKLLRRIK